ncbi:TPA: hypothetical protein ACGD69_004160 [Serratia marcescens]|uniref:hypothetical protein n=1 Tax=Serratia TaxID=613 RepID=UPI00307BE5AC
MTSLGKSGRRLIPPYLLLVGEAIPLGRKNTTLASDNIQLNTVSGLGFIFHDYEVNAMEGKRNLIGEEISISNASIMEAQEKYDIVKHLGAQRKNKIYVIPCIWCEMLWWD